MMKRSAAKAQLQGRETQHNKKQKTRVGRLFEILQSGCMAVSSVLRRSLGGNERVEENSSKSEAQEEVPIVDLTDSSDLKRTVSQSSRAQFAGNVVDVIDLTKLSSPDTKDVQERDIGRFPHSRQSNVVHGRSKGSIVWRRPRQSGQRISQLFHPYVRVCNPSENPVQLAEKETYRARLSVKYSQYRVKKSNCTTARSLELAEDRRLYINLLSSFTDGSFQISDQEKSVHHKTPRLFRPSVCGHQPTSTQSTAVSKIEHKSSIEHRLSDAKSVLSFSIAEKPVQSQQLVDAIVLSPKAKQAECEHAGTIMPVSGLKERPQLSAPKPPCGSPSVIHLGTSHHHKSLNLHDVSKKVSPPEVVEVVEVLDSPETKSVQSEKIELLAEQSSPVAHRSTPYDKKWLDGFRSWRDQTNGELEQKISIVNKEMEDYQQYAADMEREIEEKVQRLCLQSHETKKDPFVPLTNEQAMMVNLAFSAGPADEILSESFNFQIKRRDISTLSGLQWLNDEIINFYFNLIADRSRKQPNLPKVHVMSSFFYPTLLNHGYSRVRRWTKKVNIFDMDLVLLPVHLGIHWCLATIDFRSKCIYYFDSMKGSNTKCLQLLTQYVPQESEDKLKQPFSMDGWRYESLQDIPEQMNGSDCGVFACQYAEYTSRDAPINFTQEQMPYFRERMVYEILSKELL